MMLRWAIPTFCLLTLAACAKPPFYELDTAKQVVEQARTVDAEEYAPTEYEAALQALADGRALMDRGDYGAARDTFEFALEHARRAVSVANEAQAREAAEAAERARRQAAEAEARRAAERARQAAEAEKARQAAAEAAKQAPEPEPAPPEPAPEPPEVEPATTYLVGEGETLWTIAAQPSVYGDSHLWPLLYQANRDQIKDPRQIFPGQTLSIRRDLTEAEIEEARQKAEASDIFPIPE